jgi:hypothetical protein
MTEERNREAGAASSIRSGDSGPELVVRNKRDPFADMESVRNGVTIASEVRARALDVVEMYAKRTDHWGLARTAPSRRPASSRRAGRRSVPRSPGRC